MKKELLKSWNKKSFKVVFFRGSGPGGQHKNKNDTACRITDIETGLSAESQVHKSQVQNKKEAFRKLRKKLLEHHFPKVPKERAPNTERVRTYHAVRGEILDHRTSKVYNYVDCVEGTKFYKVIEETALHGAMEDED